MNITSYSNPGERPKSQNIQFYRHFIKIAIFANMYFHSHYQNCNKSYTELTQHITVSL